MVIILSRKTPLTVVIELLLAPRFLVFLVLTLLLLAIGAVYYCVSEYAHFGADRINAVPPESRTLQTDELDVNGLFGHTGRLFQQSDKLGGEWPRSDTRRLEPSDVLVAPSDHEFVAALDHKRGPRIGDNSAVPFDGD